MRLLPSVFLLCVPALALGDDGLDPHLQRFLNVYAVVEQQFADPVDPEAAFYQGVLPSMLHTLDPHSAFLNRDQYERLQEMRTSTEKGFGSVVSLLPGRVIVLQTLPGSPSARSGLSPGDEIVVINRYPLARMTIDQLISLLGQSRQDRAELMVKRPGFARLIPMDLIPAEMADPSVRRSFLIEPGLAYVKLANFDENTAEELRQAIDGLGGDELSGLILDLRGNPGGIVESAVMAAALFLKPGENILWIRAKEGPKEEVKVPEGYKPYGFRVCVLIDDQTASAAELMAGALQDHDRAWIVGVPSFGKGLVQSVFPLSEGAAVALTTARYLTPSGRSIQRPLADCQLYALASCLDSSDTGKQFKTDAGRVVEEGGGITPDEIVFPRRYTRTRFETAMEGSNSFLEFAQKHVRRHGKVSADFEVSSRMLDDFQLFLSEREIRPGLAEWSSTVGFIRSRLKQEFFNLSLGVEEGDQIEARRDPMVLAALRHLRAGSTGHP